MRPNGRVTDFRTWVSGITPHHLKPQNGAIEFEQARRESHNILKDKTVVGHSLNHDFNVLELPEASFEDASPKLKFS